MWIYSSTMCKRPCKNVPLLKFPIEINYSDQKYLEFFFKINNKTFIWLNCAKDGKLQCLSNQIPFYTVKAGVQCTAINPWRGSILGQWYNKFKRQIWYRVQVGTLSWWRFVRQGSAPLLYGLPRVSVSQCICCIYA